MPQKPLNLICWYNEKRKDAEEAKAEAHRQEMKALEEERVRAAKSAEDYAMLQYLESLDTNNQMKRITDTLDDIKVNQDYNSV